MTHPPLFRVTRLHVTVADLNHKPWFRPAPRLTLLHEMSLTIPAGRIVGIVGESGSGKSTLGKALVRLLEPVGGTIEFRGRDITHHTETQLRPLRRDLQMIFQDPMSSLNPRHTIGRIIATPLGQYGVPDARRRAYDMLERVGLGSSLARRYPHELSGGQRQRVGIARAIALEPAFVLADEIVSGLDVSSQAQILVLLKALAREFNLTIAFISHDLSVIRNLCDDVIVMENGRIVESGACATIFAAPQSPVTQALIDAIPLPEIDPGWFERAGSIPDSLPG